MEPYGRTVDATKRAPHPEVTVYATSWCPYCSRAKYALDRLPVDYHWVDVDFDPRAAETVMRINRGNRTVPTIVIEPGPTLVAPTAAQLVDALRSAGYPIPDELAFGQRLRSFFRRLFAPIRA